MGEYLLLFRGGQDGGTDHFSEKWQQHMHRWMIWMAELQKKGQFLSAQPLRHEGRQVSGPEKTIKEGPFMEGNEKVSGYLLCNADNFDEAVELAMGCPVLEFESGKVEVREIQELKV